MSSDQSRNREKLFEDLHEALRASSSKTIMYHQAIADHLGLNATDHKCLDMIRGLQSVTAGQLAEFTGLTTGSVTAVIDRLERRGWVRREKSPTDRRQVIVKPVADELAQKLGPLFHSLQHSMTQLFYSYSDEELTLLREFAIRSAQLLHEETRKLRNVNEDVRMQKNHNDLA